MAHIYGTNGIDNLVGTSGWDSINGLAGDDALKGGGGADYLDGWGGIDSAVYADSNVGVTVSLATDGGYGRGYDGTAQGDTLVNIENLYGSAFDDALTGDRLGNSLFGLSGDDNLDGGFGNDLLNGGDGEDTLKGGGGADVLYGDIGEDMLKGGGGADVLDGGADFDMADYTLSSAGVFVSLINNVGAYGDAEGDTFMSIERVAGSFNADTLWGDNGGNTLEGNDGNDFLSGFGGGDYLIGGPGNDTLRGMDGEDHLYGDEGTDTLYGGAASDALVGDTDADIMYGEDGDDRYWVENSGDMVIELGGQGSDVVYTFTSYALPAGSEVEVLWAPTFSEAGDLVGNEFDNQIIGNGGQNTIVGSPLNDGMGYDGLDVMTGDGGGDVFVWTSTNETTLAGEEADVVTDFNPADGDLLAFNLIDANAMGGTANDEFTFVGIVDVTQGGSFTAPGQIGYFTTATDTYILLNTEVDAGVDYQDATIRVAGAHTVDASWFVL
jgi:Ca2+-binding RTX toxin-like protein